MILKIAENDETNVDIYGNETKVICADLSVKPKTKTQRKINKKHDKQNNAYPI